MDMCMHMCMLHVHVCCVMLSLVGKCRHMPMPIPMPMPNESPKAVRGAVLERCSKLETMLRLF